MAMFVSSFLLMLAICIAQSQFHIEILRPPFDSWILPHHERSRVNGPREWERVDVSPSDDDITAAAASEFNPDVIVVDKGTEKPKRDIWTTLDTEDFNPFGHHNGFFDRFPFFRNPSPFMPWWQGPNVCVEKSESNGSNTTSEENGGQNDEFIHSFMLRSKQCSDTASSHTCVTSIRSASENRTVTETYRCCDGFKLIASDARTRSCIAFEVRNMIATMEAHEASKMATLTKDHGLDLIQTPNITVFAPSDKALEGYEYDQNKKDNEILAIDDVDSVTAVPVDRYTELIKRHTVASVLKSEDMEDDLLLNTMSDDQRIRINMYATGFGSSKLTANCVPVTLKDEIAENGILNVVEQILPKPTRTLAELLRENSDLSIFQSFLDAHDVNLADESNSFTIFAPSNDAFDSLDATFRERLLSKQGCSDSVLRSHLVNRTLCDAAFTGHGINVRQSPPLSLFRDQFNLYVNGVRVVKREILATNGVLHVIAKLLVPEEAKPLSTLLKKEPFQEFVKLMNESGHSVHDWDELHNVTFFLPTEEAILSMSPESRQKSLQHLDDLILDGRHHIKNWVNDGFLRTRGGHELRTNLFRSSIGFGFRPTLQCSRILASDNNVCGATVHVVDGFMADEPKNIMAQLDQLMPNSIAKQLLTESGLDERLKQEDGPFTLLAPSDEAFRRRFNPTRLAAVLKDAKLATSIMSNHIIPNSMLCCTGVMPQASLFMAPNVHRTLGSLSVNGHRDMLGRIRFDRSTVSRCDQMATNGVIHVVDQVMEPATRRPPPPFIRDFFHGFL